MYFCVNEFEVRVNDSIFSGHEQQKVYYHSSVVATRVAILGDSTHQIPPSKTRINSDLTSTVNDCQVLPY